MSLIVDAHQDLAWNAITFGRDYSHSAHTIRESELNSAAPAHNGNTLLGLPDYLRGEVAIVFGTLFAAPFRNKMGEWDVLNYKDSVQAHRLYAQQLDYYERLADTHPEFMLINTRRDLEGVLATWSPTSYHPVAKRSGHDVGRSQETSDSNRQVGIVRLMEGADGIREPKEAEWWLERGVRIIGLAWAATRYAGGTGEPGPLTPEGRRLLAEMANLGLILDLSHASDESFLEAIERFEGTIIASHANPRAMLKDPQRPERFLSDDMIRALRDRGGVTGIVPFNRFLKAGWQNADGKHAITLEHVVAMIDHVCQITGNADYVGIGSDFDGGFGVEHAPAEIDTVADLGLIGGKLKERGYAETDVEKVMGGNWLRILRRGLPA
ncbi:MAG TPA: membrane dipeptidase [Anaerolineales bacterium]|nr:membrane dipeptidase [Anaerolineales bacterium]